ncbi:hypothetical protein JM18_003873 [Phytophthora kernoviae]|uniref:Uncharacterized protein n=2 Tax=Phytophthora kernoviae TaxID=325452 RepID=A0A8T0LZ28_9STRA|nr:hypothetical protein G195_005526 [Phytophthora kernoviae 00238/432]KAG2524805.1 hypothetical protein JM16_004322 [Phytophthora kernoviae]KAG2526451.1 hypothetical protein JM18_003873 [Phytophthora kernoviae]
MTIHFFKRGLLDVEDGTSLRWYLAKRLNCEAMRVTKKLKGNSSIGKQIFRAMENTPANRQAIRRAREELAVVEARFIESLTSGGKTKPLPKPEDAKLLLHFFSEAHDGDEEPEAEKKTEDSVDEKKTEDTNPNVAEKKTEDANLSVDLSDKLGKKRPLSSIATLADNSQNATPEEQDPVSPSSKRQNMTEV